MTVEMLLEIVENPKAFLLKCRKARELIAAKRERIRGWRGLAESITATLSPDGGGIGNGYKQSIIENAVCNIAELENEILAEIEALVKTEKNVRCAIDVLIADDRHRVVLELRYLNGYSWGLIAGKLGYGEDWVCRLHGAALSKMKAAAKVTVLSR